MSNAGDRNNPLLDALRGLANLGLGLKLNSKKEPPEVVDPKN